MIVQGLREWVIERHIDLSGLGDGFEEGPIGPEVVAGALHVSCQAEVVSGTLSGGEVTLVGGANGTDYAALMGYGALDLGRSGFGTLAEPVLDSSTLAFEGLIVDGDGWLNGQVSTAESGVRLRVVFRVVGLPGIDVGPSPGLGSRASGFGQNPALAVPFVHRVFEGALGSAGQSFRAVDGGPEWVDVGPHLRRLSMHAFDLSGPQGGTAWSSGRANLRRQTNAMSDWDPTTASSSVLQSAPHVRGIDITPYARVKPNCSAAQAGVELRIHVLACGGFGYASPPSYRAYHTYDTPTNLTMRTTGSVGQYVTTTIQTHEVA